MAKPVLVTAYHGSKTTPSGSPSGRARVLPPVSAYAFADILRTVDSPELQSAIDGIAEICAKNRMSLAEEHDSHLPPVGEITVLPSPAAGRSHLSRPGMRRPLTSVPEASSSSSESSTRSRRRSIFGFGGRKALNDGDSRTIRIGSMGRTVSMECTIAMATSLEDCLPAFNTPNKRARAPEASLSHPRVASQATVSLQRLLAARVAPG